MVDVNEKTVRTYTLSEKEEQFDKIYIRIERILKLTAEVGSKMIIPIVVAILTQRNIDRRMLALLKFEETGSLGTQTSRTLLRDFLTSKK